MHGERRALCLTCGGSSEEKADIRINGLVVPVTLNLEAALKRVSSSEMSDLLWVDALCIRQADVIEKNDQIPKMTMIFASAKQVFVWLGDAQSDRAEAGSTECISDAAGAIELMKAVHEIVQSRERNGLAPSHDIVYDENSPELVTDTDS